MESIVCQLDRSCWYPRDGGISDGAIELGKTTVVTDLQRLLGLQHHQQVIFVKAIKI